MTFLDASALTRVAATRTEPDTRIAHEIRPLIEQMLAGGHSLIDPETRIWTPEAALDLRARIVDDPIEGSGLGQWEKLDIQLRGASRDVILLAAELVFLREHPLKTARPDTRRRHVESVLAQLEEPASIPEPMTSWLDRPKGTAGFLPGQRYNGAMWLHVAWIAGFVQHWAALSDAERAEARRDPWALERCMLESGTDQPDIRSVLAYLARPDAFEPISSVQKKLDIRDRLAHMIGGPSGSDPVSVDRDLFRIRAMIADEVDGTFHFWTPGVHERWEHESAESPAVVASAEPRPRRYWLFAPGERASQWSSQHADGTMAIGWDDLGDLASYESREDIRQALDVDDTGASSRNAVHALWQFQHEIEVGDVVYAKRGRREIVGRGEVASEARYEPERDAFHHVRSVEWTHAGSWEHPGDMPTKTLTDVTAFRDYVERLERLVTEEDEPPLPPPATTPYGPDDFLREVYLSAERFDRLRSLVERKKNVILAGPPGVGKTFTARRLAYAMLGAKDSERVEMVQFHQSSSYEDFMMGYRPVASGGFELKAGPFHTFCEMAADDPDRPYFFIIDEINRGNISKIFGELLMLIEADKRGQTLRLLYKDELFSVPANVHIIGMMNTADRSLAVLDYALRRRFGFFDLEPGFDSDGFALWQREAADPALDRLVGTLRELNASIADDPALGRGFLIGHSYLSQPDASAGDGLWLESVVHDELVPLLHEYWFDEPQTAEEWAQRLRDAIA